MDARPQASSDAFDAWALAAYEAGASIDRICAAAATRYPTASSRRHIHAALDRALRAERARLRNNPASVSGEGRPLTTSPRASFDHPLVHGAKTAR